MTTLHLHNAPAIIFLYGLAGSGKSYIGDLIARHTGWHVYHADDDITEAMRQALQEKRPFTDAMRDEFFKLLIGKIRKLSQQHNHLIVTQAVYKQKHRNQLQQQIPGLELIWIKADDDIIASRLQSRHHGIKLESAAALRKDFEIPNENCKVIINERDEESIIRQLNNLFSD